MSSAVDILKRAGALHRGGELRAAEALYRQVLAAEAENFDACYGLAVALHAQQKPQEAVEYFQQAVRLRPFDAEARLDLGTVLGQLERLDESVASLEEAAGLAPGSRLIAEALAQAAAGREHRRAVECMRDGRLDEAEACCRRIVGLMPNYPAAHESLGNVLVQQGRRDEAAACYQRAIELDERFVPAHRRLGVMAMEDLRYAEAEARFRRACELKPELADAHNDLGAALVEQGKNGEAERSFRRVVELAPDGVEGHSNLGAALGKQQRWSEAILSLRRAIELDPNYAEAQFNLAKTFKEQNRLEEAVAGFRRALALKPDYVDAELGLAFALLTMGRLAEGWPHYEARWKKPELKDMPLGEPRWRGDDLAGRTILVGREQGYGDTLQLVRYARLLKERGGRVIVECAPPLAGLLATCPGVDEVAIAGGPLPAFDVFAPLMSLPGILGTTLETIPGDVPYLRPEAARVSQWRSKLGDEGGLKVGIAWQGNPSHRSDRWRSIPLAAFEPVVRTRGVRWFSLQVGAGRDQLGEFAEWPIADLGDALADFDDTAAAMSNLDLVITCDSAPAHLAGALGVPAWVALHDSPDWRWFLARDDSPWYPSARLFRQTRAGDWSDVFARIAEALSRLVAERKGP